MCIFVYTRSTCVFLCICLYLCVYTIGVCVHVSKRVYVCMHDQCFFPSVSVCICVYTVSVCIHVSASVYLCMLPAKLEQSNFVGYAFLYETCLNGSLCGHLRYMYKCQYIDIFIYQYLFIYLSFYV